mmetsp:Transcript_5958/g.16179  ORF Transcript_5958/g.16179 Transcript_5958/m.16179 type:complete len:85 (+) Transcript_5958:116-370(+)
MSATVHHVPIPAPRIHERSLAPFRSSQNEDVHVPKKESWSSLHTMNTEETETERAFPRTCSLWRKPVPKETLPKAPSKQEGMSS